MPKLVWDQTTEHLYETGVNQCALYLQDSDGKYPTGVAWNGISSIQESPSGADASDIYADNIKYLTLRAAEDFGATIEAYTYPDEFAVCDGTAAPTKGVYIGQQTRKAFGLAYKTLIGNDTEGTDYGYKLHLIYNATASPSEKQYQTVNDSPEAISFSWEISTVAVNVDGYKPTATITIDSTKADKAKLTALEETLFGSDSGTAKLPSPSEVIAMMSGE